MDIYRRRARAVAACSTCRCTSRSSRTWSPGRSCAGRRCCRSSRTSAGPTWSTPPAPCGSSRAGLFKKVVVANYLAQTITDPVFGAPESATAAGTSSAPRYAFSVQIYADFSGYTDIAIGVRAAARHQVPRELRPAVHRGQPPGLLASLAHDAVAVAARLPVHPARRQPRSRGGGSTATCSSRCCSAACGTARAGRFVIWGSLHGAGLMRRALAAGAPGRRRTRCGPRPIERLRTGLGLETSHGEVPVVRPDGIRSTLRDVSDREPDSPHEPNPWLGRLVTFSFVTFAWIFFRANSVADAWDFIAGIFTTLGLDRRSGDAAGGAADRRGAGGAVPAARVGQPLRVARLPDATGGAGCWLRRGPARAATCSARRASPPSSTSSSDGHRPRRPSATAHARPAPAASRASGHDAHGGVEGRRHGARRSSACWRRGAW